MRTRALNVAVAIGMVLSLLAITVSSGVAQNNQNDGNEASELILPWVPNGAWIVDQRVAHDPVGPFYGSIVVQNLEAEEVTVHFEVMETGHTGQETLDPQGSMDFDVDELFGDADVEGSGVRIHAENGARIAAVQKQASPEAPGDYASTGAGHEMVAGYTALSDSETEVVLPIVQTNNNWNTLVRVTNFGGGQATVQMTLHEAEGASAPVTVDLEIDAGATETFDLLGSDEIAAEWVGSARISSNMPVAAVAERVKHETKMLIMNTSQPAEDGAQQYAPLIFRDWNGWNTGISIANLADAVNEVTISYYSMDGTLVDTDELSVPANGMNFVHTPASVLDGDGGFVGSAIISADHPFRGAVDEVKYLGNDDDTGHAMSYMVEDFAAKKGESLTMPLFQSPSENGTGDTTGIQLFNPTDSWVAGAVYFNVRFGFQVGDPVIVHLGPREGYTVYQDMMTQFPSDIDGTALIQVYAGDGAITGASNSVNYEVQFDGSASFNLAPAGDAGPEPPDRVLIPEPRMAANPLEQEFVFAATMVDVDGQPIVGEELTIAVNFSEPGPPGDAWTVVTDENGRIDIGPGFFRTTPGVDTFQVIYPAWDPDTGPTGEPGFVAYAWKTWLAE